LKRKSAAACTLYGRARQQGKGTDSCPEITEQQKNFTMNKN